MDYIHEFYSWKLYVDPEKIKKRTTKEGSNSSVFTDTAKAPASMLAAALFIIARMWKFPKYPSINEYRKYHVCMHSYSELFGHKRDGSAVMFIIWMNLDDIVWN